MRFCLYLLTCLSACGQFVNGTLVNGNFVGTNATAVTWILAEGFEGSNPDTLSNIGYDNTGWRHDDGYSPTPEPHFSTSGLGLSGTYCLRLNAQGDAPWHPLTAITEVWVYFKFRSSAWNDAAANTIFALTPGWPDAKAHDHCGVWVNGSPPVLYVKEGGTASTPSVGTMALNTTYHCWLYFKNDGHASFGFSTDGVRPTTGNNFTSMTNGEETGSIEGLSPWVSIASVVFYYDDIRISATQIGDNPP